MNTETNERLLSEAQEMKPTAVRTGVQGRRSKADLEALAAHVPGTLEQEAERLEADLKAQLGDLKGAQRATTARTLKRRMAGVVVDKRRTSPAPGSWSSSFDGYALDTLDAVVGEQMDSLRLLNRATSQRFMATARRNRDRYAFQRRRQADFWLQ